jgi:hypothetical protein
MLLDARNPDEVPATSRSKVVIVGAGTIGLVMAVECAKAKVPVTVVEAGGRVADTYRSQKTASCGKPHNGVTLGRAFGLGGTSVLWGGQLGEFEPGDIARNGLTWALPYAELVRWYDYVYELLGIRDRLPAEKYRQKFGDEREVNESVERFFTHWLLQPNFAVLFRREISSNPLIKVVLNATVNDISFFSARAQFVRASAQGAREIRFFADKFVFAAGTIEASRFFLSTQRLSPVPWKANSHIGKHFQDHLGGKIAKAEILNESRFRNFFENGFDGALKLQPKLRFTKKSREETLTGVCGSFSFDSEIGEKVNKIKMLIRGLRSGAAFSTVGITPSDARALARTFFPLVIRYLRDRRILALFDRGLEFHVQAEQLPIDNSRIKLSKAPVGPDGLFEAELDWQIDGREISAISRFARQTDAYLRSNGIARLHIDEMLLKNDCTFLSKLSDTYHQCGGLRMANNEAAGFVDPDCRVWGTANVFVAGSSVFPTSSYANCTLTALALAVRLAASVKGAQ